MLKRSHLFAAAVCFCVFTTQSFAQSTPPPASSEGWRVRLIPYLWGAGLNGRVGIGDRSADVDASFSDLLKELNFGFMSLLEADRNKFVTVTDLVYMNLSDEHATPGPLFSSAESVQKQFILSPEAGYRVAGSENSFVDVLGGIRFSHVNGELNFGAGVLPALDLSQSRNWVDGVFALRGRTRLSPTWSLTGYGDIGGGGSNLTYQIVGTAAADLSRKYALVFGYRYLNIAYNKDRFLFDLGIGGPIVGFAFKF